MPRSIETIAAEANRLYWDTETSVSDIAAQLELSRRALYSALEPLPTDRSCAVCGSPLVYENRSARASRTPTCPNGDSVDEQPDDVARGASYATAPASGTPHESAARSGRAGSARDSGERRRGTAWTWSRGSADASASSATDGAGSAVVLGAAVAGAAIGALVTLLLVPRR